MARDEVFISYSHVDSDWLNRLQIMLTPLKRKGIVKVWADTCIDPGKKWRIEIEKALQKAKVALLLVSHDFLASECIWNKELPALLEDAEKDGVIIIWAPVRESLYEVTDIARYQAVCDPSTPFYALTLPQQDAMLKKIANILMEIRPLSSSAPAPITTPTPEQVPSPTGLTHEGL